MKRALAVLFMSLVLPGLATDKEAANHNGSSALEGAMVEKGAGIVSKPSSHSVDQTVDKLKEMLKAKGVTLFAVIDHSGEAAKVGMKMRNTKLVIFGNPKGGTPLMLAAPALLLTCR